MHGTDARRADARCTKNTPTTAIQNIMKKDDTAAAQATEVPPQVITVELWKQMLHAMRGHPHTDRWIALLKLFSDCVNKTELSLTVDNVRFGMKKYCKHQPVSSIIAMVNQRLRAQKIGFSICPDGILRSAFRNVGNASHTAYVLKAKPIPPSKTAMYKAQQTEKQKKMRTERRSSRVPD